jgi:hypothetical protein
LAARDVLHSICSTTDGGYIFAGYHSNIHYQYPDYWVCKINAAGEVQWQVNLGGSREDIASAIRQTSDGGYIVAGYSNSIDGLVSGNHGGYDYWIVKLTSTGVIEWQRSLGGSRSDRCFSICEIPTGGYLAAGISFSNDGDVTHHYGSTDNSDIWIVRLTANGAIEWQKTLGGTADEAADLYDVGRR